MKIFDFQQVIHHLLSLKKKSSPTAAVIVAFTVFEIKKTKNFMKLEYISYTTTLDYKKKIKMQQNRGFKKKIKILLKNLMVFGLEKLYFSFNHKTRGSLYRETNTQQAKKRVKSIGWFVIELQLQQIWKM